jgi:Ca-activated chloride channel family protein
MVSGKIQSPVLTRIKVDFNGFSVSEVEPAGVPDLFAERPIILFGKWRGQPQGKITLTGLSGEGPYREVIEVKEITPLFRRSKPVPGNAFLKTRKNGTARPPGMVSWGK